jgi:hypothetical protein
LAPLIKTNSLALVEYLTATVADSNLNVQQVARNLENEGIEWSNQKIARVLNALHSLHHSFTPEIKDTMRAELS